MSRSDRGRASAPLLWGIVIGIGASALVAGAIVALDDDPVTDVVETVDPSVVAQESPVVTTSTLSSSADVTEPAERVNTGSTPTPGDGPSVQPVECPPATTTVNSAEQLHSALDVAAPGDSISIADGTYVGKFVTTKSGTAEQPIYLCGGAGAVLDGDGIDEGYVLHLNGVNHWRVAGFTVRNGQKGVVADATSNSIIQGLTVEDIGDEAIHLRSASTYNVVLDNVVRRTGLRRDKFGEGVYVGSAVSNWPNYSGGQPDRSDYNVVQGNNISQTGSESIDVKEGTTGGRVVGNVMDGTGMTGADSLVDIKGNDWVIEGNVGQHAEEAMQTHRIEDGWGTGNIFRDNTVDVDGDGRHFYIHDPDITDNVVSCSNHTSAGEPIRSNVECTP